MIDHSTHPAVSIDPILSDALVHLPGVRHGFFTRAGGVSEGIYAGLNTGLGSNDDRSAVRENRRRVAGRLGVDETALISPFQVHGRDVVVVTTAWEPGAGPRCDGIVTKERGLAVSVGTADCGPVLFADAEAGVIGAAHSGWRGAFLDIISSVLDEMEGLGADRARTVAVLGPTISRNAYEVGPEFVDRFINADPGHDRFFLASDRVGHACFDLPAFIEHQARAADVGRFERLDLCTYADESRFFSYRRTTHRGEPDYGRLLSAIVLT